MKNIQLSESEQILLDYLETYQVMDYEQATLIYKYFGENEFMCSKSIRTLVKKDLISTEIKDNIMYLKVNKMAKVDTDIVNSLWVLFEFDNDFTLKRKNFLSRQGVISFVNDDSLFNIRFVRNKNNALLLKQYNEMVLMGDKSKKNLVVAFETDGTEKVEEEFKNVVVNAVELCPDCNLFFAKIFNNYECVPTVTILES